MRKIIPVVVAGATTLALAGGALGYLSLDKAVTLSVDGQASQVKTSAGTVGALLASRGIQVGEHDVLAPSADTKLTEGSLVAIRFGRQVTFSVDGRPQTIWTTATTVDGAAAALGLDTAGADLSTSRSTLIGRQGLAVSVATPKTITLVVGGKKRTFTTTAQTVGAALAAAKITADADDKLSVPAATTLRDGLKIRYTKIQVSTVTKKLPVAYGTTRTSTSKLSKGVTKVKTAGRSGLKSVTYRVIRADGKIAKRTTLTSKVLTRPVTEVLLVGTKVVRSPSGGGAGGGVWDKIAKCESGGNWSINTGNGFYGGLQFTLSTWHAYGGKGYPNKASKATQIAIAKKVQKSQGWGAWPACTRKLGLR